jgi:hypothetical protein
MFLDTLSPSTLEEGKQLSVSAAAATDSAQDTGEALGDEDENIFTGNASTGDGRPVQLRWGKLMPRWGVFICIVILFVCLFVRWRTRVFACVLLRRTMTLCECERAHTDLALAKELVLGGGKSMCCYKKVFIGFML